MERSANETWCVIAAVSDAARPVSVVLDPVELGAEEGAKVPGAVESAMVPLLVGAAVEPLLAPLVAVEEL